MKKNRKAKKAGIIAGSVVALGIVAGGATVGIINGNKKITIRYESDGGGIFSESSIKKGSGIKLPTPLKKGYKFMGWYLDAECTPGNKVEDTTKFSKDTVLYANWKASTYTINLVDERGIVKNLGNIIGGYEQQKVGISNPSDTAYYKFLGWSEKRNAEESEIERDVRNGNTYVEMPLYGGVFYAQWEGKEVEVELPNGSKYNGKVGESFILPTVKESGIERISKYIINNKEYNPGSKIELKAEDITISGSKLTIRVDYTTSAERKIRYIDYDGTEIGQASGIENGLLKPIEIEGYEFKGWYTEEGYTREITEREEDKEEIEKQLANGQVILYAKREGKKAVVTVNYKDAIEIEEGKKEYEVKVGDEIQLPTARGYAKTNLDFSYWKVGGKVVGNAGEIYKVRGDITLEAVWGSAFNLLSFNYNGGTGDIGEIDYREAERVKLPTVEPERLGYTFKGWSADREWDVLIFLVNVKFQKLLVDDYRLYFYFHLS